MNTKQSTARLSVVSNSGLIILKVIVGIMTGSVSIISEAIHSTMDLFASIIAFFSVRISDKPADEGHPYGHGKYENVSGVIEGLLIFAAAVWIIIESVGKIINPGEVESLGFGFVVMFISAGVNLLVSQKLYKVAKQEDSIALEADALHLKTDVYSSLGVGVGLLLIWATGLNYLDPVVAILVALFILKESLDMIKDAFNPLLDVKLSDDEIEVIKDVMAKYNSVYLDFHKLRTRKSGSAKYVDLHLVFPYDVSVGYAHEICDEIEKQIEDEIKGAQVLIHIES